MTRHSICLTLALGFLGSLHAAVPPEPGTPEQNPVKVVFHSDDEALEARLAELQDQANRSSYDAAQQLYTQYAIAGKSDVARAWASRYLEILTEKAEAGDKDAMTLLGIHYLSGKDYTPQNVELGVKWLHRAAEAGSARSGYILGDYFARQGDRAASNEAYAKAYAAYSQEAAEQGSPESVYWQGLMLQNGLGVEKDSAAGIAKLEQAAGQNHPAALQQLFKTYAAGIGTKQDMARAIPYARKAADNGDGLMAYATACAYLKGSGVEKDEATGEKYLNQASAANIPSAIYYKGLRLENAGKATEAYPLYRQASSMGLPDAMVAEGRFLLYGLGGNEKDESRGLSLLQAASDRWGSPQAPYELAVYYDGIGETAMANSWYVTACNRGVLESYARRGLLHLNPFSGLEWSPTYAYQWWRAGDNAGDPTCTLYIRLFLFVFIPLLLILVFGVPIFIVHRLNKRCAAQPPAPSQSPQNT